VATLAAANDADAGATAIVALPPSLKVEDRLSLELVIALVGPVASGVSTAGKMITETLESQYDYIIHPIKISPIIKDHAHEVGEVIPDGIDGEARIEKYQIVGNKLRERKSKHFLADCVIDRISKFRIENGGFYTSQDGGVAVPVQKRFAYVIDSLKNPAELFRLRQIYGDLLWVVTVFAPHDVRKGRLTASGGDEIAAQKVMKRDQQDDEGHGQQVSKTAYLADFFIRNNNDTREFLKAPVTRFLEVIFGVKLHTPTFDEQGMMRAAAAALESACLSRQVGASIYSKTGELIGVGCNDVPKYLGGLYSENDGDHDKRCFRWGGQVCHNDERKARLARAIAKSVSGSASGGEISFERAFAATAQSEAKNLIEFSRSVHAEMEAIVSVAREGKGATSGGTLFTTTYPCHNCARHIVAAGIVRVVFIEPYSKSLAIDLHHDSISETDEENHVKFQQYEGFAPRAAMRAFSSAGRDRKIEGKIIESNPRLAKPLFPTPLDSYINSEGLVIQQLTEG
jgi:deoxycytidylate deaminase